MGIVMPKPLPHRHVLTLDTRSELSLLSCMLYSLSLSRIV